MENSIVFVVELLHEQITFVHIGKNVRRRVRSISMDGLFTCRNNIEEEDLLSNFDGRRVLWFNCLQGLQRRTTS